MTLDEFVATLPPPPDLPEADANAALVAERLDAGCLVECAGIVMDGLGIVPGPCVLLRILPATGSDGGRPVEILPLGLGAISRTLVRERLGGLAVVGATAPVPSLARQLADLLAVTTGMPVEARAGRLIAWIMDQIGASRCALVPVDAGVLSAPLALQSRGGRTREASELARLPRQVLEAALRTRQPVVSHDVTDPASPLSPPSESVSRQNIRSYMAVPVLLRGEMLAIAYIDRFETPRAFSLDEQATFQALAYELARPILTLRDQQREGEMAALRDAAIAGEAPDVDVPVSAGLRAVVERAKALAPHADEHLLLLGETGVGKEWLARRIHDWSGRKGPFLAVNVSAIPSELLESELMGSARGAFTGAIDRIGRVLEAEGGTLFLDEVGDLDLPGQVRLLRFLQDRRVRAVGGRVEREADVRLVAATNRPVHALVREGGFRADLLHRFAPPLVIPPLRERREEILPLAEAWIAATASQRGLPAPDLTEAARAFVVSHSWPGNVRQLRAVLRHGVILARGRAIDRADIEPLVVDDAPVVAPAAPAPPIERPATLAERRARAQADEAAWLRDALARHGGNVEATARALGCPGTSLRHLLRRHGLLPAR